MNDSKTKKLFAAARREPTPEAPFHFPQRIVRTLRRDAVAASPVSALETLAALFPRFVMAALLIIGVCVAAEFYLERPGDYAAAAEQWFFNME
jgi:hypothetical protein